MRLLPLLAAAAMLAALAPPPAGADAEPALQVTLECGGAAGAVRMMEQTYIEDGCWAHVGIHQYYVGRDTVFALDGGRGRAYVVEQQLSPPIEVASVDPATFQLNTAVFVETSLDGIAWEAVEVGEYRFLGLQPGGTSFRQDVFFDFTADGQEFRFVRIRNPLSAAQGLSGYIDFTTLQLDVRAVRAVEPPALTQQQGVQKLCLLDLMEDPWLGHPCTFGGVEHWDSPSFFHTYFLGDARLDRIQGTAILAYFRPDDPGTCCGQTVPMGILTGEALVQTSVDGVAWDTVARIAVTYGAPASIDVDGLGGKPAGFVRLVGEKHPGYWRHPALKHPEGYLVYSDLALTGLLPS